MTASLDALLDAVRDLAVLGYSIEAAAKACGYSASTIRRAIDSGDLTAYYPLIDGRPVSKPSVLPEDLRAWLIRNRTPPARKAS